MKKSTGNNNPQIHAIYHRIWNLNQSGLTPSGILKALNAAGVKTSIGTPIDNGYVYTALSKLKTNPKFAKFKTPLETQVGVNPSNSVTPVTPVLLKIRKILSADFLNDTDRVSLIRREVPCSPS